MAVFAGSLRGDGLMRVHTALTALEENPQHLDYAMSRFAEPPPPYTSEPSGTTTRSQSPNPPTNEQRSRQERLTQLQIERYASDPYHQFSAQTIEEEKRIWEAHGNGTRCLRVGEDASRMADEAVKQRWVEQGLWSDKWTSTAIGQWKHEEPLEVESDWETDPEAPPAPLFPPPPKAKRLKNEDARRKIAERRALREREREASRPYHQFLYQVSRERTRLQQEAGGGDKFVDNINTKAYENVKNTWMRRKIWREQWGIMPGMSWKHEKPWNEAVAELGLEDPIVQEASLPTSYQPTRPPLSGRPARNEILNLFIGNPAPVMTATNQAPDFTAVFQREQGVDVNPIGRSHGDVQPGDLVPMSSQPQSIQPSQVATRGNRASSNSSSGLDHRPHLSSNTALSRTHSRERANLVVAGKIRRSRRAIRSPDVLNDDIPASSNKPRRRSARLQLLAPGSGTEAILDAPPTRQETRRRNRLGVPQPKAPAKPQGVSKKRATKKARKRGI